MRTNALGTVHADDNAAPIGSRTPRSAIRLPHTPAAPFDSRTPRSAIRPSSVRVKLENAERRSVKGSGATAVKPTSDTLGHARTETYTHQAIRGLANANLVPPGKNDWWR